MDLSRDRIKQIIKEELESVHHGHHGKNDEGIRVKRHLDKIGRVINDLLPAFEDDEDVPEWIQEKVAVVAAILQSVLDYKDGEEVR